MLDAIWNHGTTPDDELEELNQRAKIRQPIILVKVAIDGQSEKC